LDERRNIYDHFNIIDGNIEQLKAKLNKSRKSIQKNKISNMLQKTLSEIQSIIDSLTKDGS